MCLKGEAFLLKNNLRRSRETLKIAILDQGSSNDLVYLKALLPLANSLLRENDVDTVIAFVRHYVRVCEGIFASSANENEDVRASISARKLELQDWLISAETGKARKIRI